MSYFNVLTSLSANIFQLQGVLRYFASILLAMFAIYGIILITRWIGKKWGKH